MVDSFFLSDDMPLADLLFSRRTPGKHCSLAGPWTMRQNPLTFKDKHAFACANRIEIGRCAARGPQLEKNSSDAQLELFPKDDHAADSNVRSPLARSMGV